MRIGRKIYLACTALLVVAIVTTGFLVNQLYYSALVTSTDTYATMLVQQISVNFNTLTKEYEDSLLSMVQNWKLFENYFNHTGSVEYYNRQALAGFVNTRNTTRSPIQDIYLLDAEGNLTSFHAGSQSFNQFDTEIADYIVQGAETIPKGAGWLVTQQPGMVYMLRSVYDVINLEYQGVVAFGIQKDVFLQQFQTVEQGQGGHLLITNGAGALVFGGPEGLPALHTLLPLQPQPGVQAIEGDRYLYRRQATADGKWNILYLVPEHTLFSQAKQMQASIILVCMAFILASGLLMGAISGSLTRGIRRVIAHLKDVKKGEWQPIPPPYSHDEIGEITLAYNDMVGDLHGLVDTISKQAVENERANYRALQAEFKELQAMINPHFIYNAMESINARAKLAGQEEIAYMCTALARLMRASLGRNSVIPLTQELQYLHDYLDIQRFIMGERLEVEYDFTTDLADYLIPALTLQPLVENAIVHGVEGMEENAVIFITVTRETLDIGEFLVVLISDNGRGMDTGDVWRRVESEHDEDTAGHFGLASVVKRIKIFYGEPYGIDISSQPGQGATVKVVLPAHSRKAEK